MYHIGSLAQAWCCADLTVACFYRAVSCWTLDEVVNRFATWVNDTSWNVVFCWCSLNLMVYLVRDEWNFRVKAGVFFFTFLSFFFFSSFPLFVTRA